MTKYVRGEIRITKIPAGEAPLWVREEWVGLVIPVGEICALELADGEPWQNDPRKKYIVPQAQALVILERKSPKAAVWFKEHGCSPPVGCFAFNLNEAETVGSLKERVAPNIRPFFGLLEEGVGAHDAWVNQ